MAKEKKLVPKLVAIQDITDIDWSISDESAIEMTGIMGDTLLLTKGKPRGEYHRMTWNTGDEFNVYLWPDSKKATVQGVGFEFKLVFAYREVKAGFDTFKIMGIDGDITRFRRMATIAKLSSP